MEKARPSAIAQQASPTYESIAARAYEIWVASGRQPGHDKENWLQAERELRAGKSLRH